MRWLLRLIGLGVTLVVVAVVGLFLIPSEQIARLAARQFEAMTGRSIQISGAVHPSVWPYLGASTGPVQIGNADWSTEGPMLSAEGLSIGLDLAALIRGETVIRNVDLHRPVIVLERNADGAGNWEFGGGSSAPATGDSTAPNPSAPAGGPQVFTLDRGRISDGTLIWIDHTNGQRLTLTGLEADIAIPDFNGPAHLALSAEQGGQRLAVTADLAKFSQSISGAVAPLVAEVEGDGIGGSFSGRLGLAPFALDGAVDLTISQPAAVFGLLGQPDPGLPVPLGLAGQVTLVPEGSAHLRQGRMQLGSTSLTGDADLYLTGERPKLVAQVSVPVLDMAALTGAPQPAAAVAAQPAGAATAAGWPTDAIDATGLNALDAEISLDAGAVVAGPLHLGQTRMVLRLDAGRAVFDLRDVAAYAGHLTGEFVVNARGGLSVGGTLQFADVAIAPLLTDLAHYDRLSGTGTLAVKFLGSGASVDAILRSLSGKGTLQLGKGTLRGLDLAGIVRSLTVGGPNERAQTVFDSLAASFGIDAGVLSNNDLALVAPYVTAAGKGTVDIGGQRLDYLLAATLQAEQGGDSVTVPVQIRGPWADPVISLDLAALVDANFAEEKARLKAEAEARLAAEAAKIGVVARDGESLEDAAKRTIAEKAAGELDKLLTGGNPAPAAGPAPVARDATAGGAATDPAPAPSSPEDVLKSLLLKQLGG